MDRFLIARLSIFALLACLIAESSLAFDAPIAIKERSGVPPPAVDGPCALATSTDGTCANYRWYNLCSGYIWLFNAGDQGVGTRFGGPEQPCVQPCRRARRVITYWRNIVPNYGQTVDIYLDDDADLDGCPDFNLASDLGLDPGLRWNCSETNVCFASTGAIVRLVSSGSAPTLATDGPFSQECDPLGIPRSFYYDRESAFCVAWDGPTERDDNFLSWLIIDTPEEAGCIDCPPTATEPNSWGGVKSLFR